LGREGVGGVNVLDPCPTTLNPPATDGVDGVRGNDPCEDGEPRFIALLIGRKIPAPTIEVVKYDMLYDLSAP